MKIGEALRIVVDYVERHNKQDVEKEAAEASEVLKVVFGIKLTNKE